MTVDGRRIAIRGTVQGVGFRPWVYRLARDAGLTGRVRNDAAGVTIEAFGPAGSLDRFCRRLAAHAPPAAAIREIRAVPIPAEPARGFRIVESAPGPEPRVSIPADLATCEACRREVDAPRDRRHRYAFTNCTDCGPRFTIAVDAPYDRARTTMGRFEMCPACRREYEAPGDRRFHAEPNACPDCGPQLRLLDAAGGDLAPPDPLRAAARALVRGRIVAVKGIGGFQLACDATSSLAVERLRARKRREAKPLAVMVADLVAARGLAKLGPEEEALLAGVERPIVLAPRRTDAPEALVPEIAPDSSLVGLMLPCSPLHHLLVADAGRPLVMTSGNLSDEPIARENAEALARLGDVADRFLVHDREIAARCDDSVARVIAGQPVVLRRARGWVPRPVPLHRPVERPILACGGQLKNAICLAVGDAAFLGAHVGDLETLESYEAFEESIDRMRRFVGVAPEAIAHDLHPEYLSTRWALAREGLPRIGVQHHHAHVASLVAERGVDGPVLGLAWDGAGYGPDGSSWGGELLLADAVHCERLATFRPLPLPGGDAAVREPWRLALALLVDVRGRAPDLERFPLFDRIPERDVAVVQRMLARGVNAPPAHGVGRLFDAVGALVLDRPVARFEGEVALAWNLAADPRERGVYPFALREDRAPWEVDLRPALRALLDDLERGCATATLAGRFHETLAAVAASLVRRAAARGRWLPVALSGGCFQNPLLVERIAALLGSDFELLLHRDVPPGDGGLALGQALVADARLRYGGGSPCV